MEEIRRIISVKVEWELAKEIRVYRECGVPERERPAIEWFIEDCVKKYPEIKRNEIEKLVVDVLDRTLNDKRKNKDDDDGR